MEIKRHPLYYRGQLMPWAKGVVVKEPKGFVFLSGTTGIDPDSPDLKLGKKWGEHFFPHAKGAEAQTRLCLEKIKARLEEFGTSLDYMVKIVGYVVGPDFPRGVGRHPNWLAARKAMDDFFKQHCPDLCWDKNPPNIDLIGVSGLGGEDQLIEIAVTAVLPD